jgi:hypothetical protein
MTATLVLAPVGHRRRRLRHGPDHLRNDAQALSIAPILAGVVPSAHVLLNARSMPFCE